MAESNKYGGEKMATNDRVKMYLEGIDKLMAQLDQATEQFRAVQEAISDEMDNLENSLKDPSKNAFKGNSNEIKAGLISQYDLLRAARKICLDAKQTLIAADAQIAQGINTDLFGLGF